ncbi:MAG: phosphopantetheine-binding protein [Thermodesulfobacteriota bacterium]
MPITRENVLSAIQKARTAADVTKLRDDVKLADQGLDSLDIFNLLLVLSESYHIEIPDADVERLETINSIIEYLDHRLA